MFLYSVVVGSNHASMEVRSAICTMSIIRMVHETIFIVKGTMTEGENGINREEKIPIATSSTTNPTNLGFDPVSVVRR